MDIQISDNHYHFPLKAGYRDKELELMLRQLSENPSKIPSASGDEKMAMLINTWKDVKVDNVRGFKSFFVTNALDGS